MTLLDRFLKYVSFDTQSDPDSTTYPSTLKQHKLADYLVKELLDLGVDNAFKDEFAYVYGIIPGKINKKIGLIAHMDTATEMSGANIKPNIIENYDGKDIKLASGLDILVKDFPFLTKFKGNTLVTTSGDTLLGADDKAGIAVIMTLIEKRLVSKNDFPTIYVCFTPDEEIGGGTDHFNVKYFDVDFAYTLDGSSIDTINFENFNACNAIVTIEGNSIHPGEAYQRLINSQEVAVEFHNLLPHEMRPEYTKDYEGFFHLTDMVGEVQKTTLKYIIRDHDLELFKQKKALILSVRDDLNKKYKNKIVEVELKDQYFNMAELIKPHPEIIEIPRKALKDYNIEMKCLPIRGGTDGAMLSFKGILCPNLGTGSYNHHGAKELANITEMNQFVDILITMLTKYIK